MLSSYSLSHNFKTKYTLMRHVFFISRHFYKWWLPVFTQQLRPSIIFVLYNCTSKTRWPIRNEQRIQSYCNVQFSWLYKVWQRVGFACLFSLKKSKHDEYIYGCFYNKDDMNLYNHRFLQFLQRMVKLLIIPILLYLPYHEFLRWISDKKSISTKGTEKVQYISPANGF